MRERRLWFKAKSHGWGWYPSAWQGWLILGLHLLAVTVSAVLIAGGGQDSLAVGLLLTVLSTLAVILLCYRHGEPPRWRWGDRAQ